jgi:hypothetical protein
MLGGETRLRSHERIRANFASIAGLPGSVAVASGASIKVAPARLAPPGAVARKGDDLPMQDQPSDMDLGRADDEADREVLALLLESDLSGPWSVWELGLQLGSELAAADAVMRVHAAGLVHVCHEFVWPTRTAARLHRLADTA